MEPVTPSPAPQLNPPPPQKKPSIVGGLVLIAIGVLFLLQNMLPDFDFGDYWPLILVAIGVGLLWNSRKGQQ